MHLTNKIITILPSPWNGVILFKDSPNILHTEIIICKKYL